MRVLDGKWHCGNRGGSVVEKTVKDGRLMLESTPLDLVFDEKERDFTMTYKGNEFHGTYDIQASVIIWDDEDIWTRMVPKNGSLVSADLEKKVGEDAPVWKGYSEDPQEQMSVVQDSIKKKGKSSYYYAHSREGKSNETEDFSKPRLIGQRVPLAIDDNTPRRLAVKPVGCNPRCKTISVGVNFADMPDGDAKHFEIYISLEKIGDVAADAVKLSFSETSLGVFITDEQETIHKFECSQLFGTIRHAEFKVIRKKRVVVTLHKKSMKNWWAIAGKGKSRPSFNFHGR